MTPVGGIEAERAAAGQDDRVHLVDRVDGIEQIGFTRARARAPRTSTPPMAPALARITVQPVGRSGKVT